MEKTEDIIQKIKRFLNLISEGESEKVSLGSLFPTVSGINRNIMVQLYREPRNVQYTETLRKSLTDVLDSTPVTSYFKSRLYEYLMGLYSIGQTYHVINEFIRITNPQHDLTFSIFDEDFAEPLERLFYTEQKKFDAENRDDLFKEWNEAMRNHYQ